jgi:hypothetical protein
MSYNVNLATSNGGLVWQDDGGGVKSIAMKSCAKGEIMKVNPGGQWTCASLDNYLQAKAYYVDQPFDMPGNDPYNEWLPWSSNCLVDDGKYYRRAGPIQLPNNGVGFIGAQILDVQYNAPNVYFYSYDVAGVANPTEIYVNETSEGHTCPGVDNLVRVVVFYYE